MAGKVIVLGLVILLWGPFATTATAYDDVSFLDIKVMTQNLYVGADVFTVFPVTIDELPLRVAQLFATVQATNFQERAKVLADIIARKRPVMIGLQEVSLIRRQHPSDFLSSPAAQPNAVNVVSDYLDILLQELDERDLDYSVAAVIENVDVELPIAVFDAGGSPLGLDDIRLTDRDVILARDSVDIRDSIAGNYPTRIVLSFEIPLPVGSYPFVVEVPRGFAAVNATWRGKDFWFINTHLEGKSGFDNPMFPFIQAGQARELLEVLAVLTDPDPSILVGDFNSERGDRIRFIDGQLLVPPYTQIVFARFVDMWQRNVLKWLNPEGPTCCQQEDLLNVDSQLDQRIDLIFVRNRYGSLQWTIPGLELAVVVGDEQRDKTNTFPPLWPSDHGGVVGKLFIPEF